ncbi:unnamed protein product [Acanthosepion pharaonis]|uniref:EGF-like domain-containing protein n=1 Tax=Acanthosepion pharaonis TaxID=158019 RepID=A0A812B2V4_ACAPH|nr:unnamed protein product [Sepia pharaonis]
MGSRCHIKQCTSITCPDGEECSQVGSYQLCSCKKPLIEGVHCVVDIDFCKDNNCDLKGTKNCTNLQYDYLCDCLQGFSGRYCEVTPCDPGCDHGTCRIDSQGSWVCECHQGWKGTNCTELDPVCDRNPCQNDGKCIGNLIDFNCICSAQYQNKTCDVVVDACETVNPCVGESNACQNLFTRSGCACLNGKSGFDCNDRPICTPTKCLNGGTCEIKNYIANCICPIGFEGRRCHIISDPCSYIKNCNKTDCENQGQQAFCKCVNGKIGQHCNQDALYDVDLFFPKSKGFIQRTPIPMWSPLTGNFLSLAFWIKYYLPLQEDVLTTSLVLYGTNHSNDISPISELLSLDNDTLTIQFSEMKSFNLSVVDDGWWHHVFITWFNNVISVYLDFNRIINEPYGKDKTLPMYGVLIPGGIINISRHEVRPSKFAGRINRLVLFNSTWSAEEVKNIRNNINQVLQDVILDFYRSVLDMANILLEFPSEITQNMCELTPNCSESNRGQFPVVEFCPHAQLKVGPRWSIIDFIQPKFNHNYTTVSNYIHGVSYFDWGLYSIEYIAFGKNNETSAVCTFQLVSRRFSCNETINSIYLNKTDRNCQQHNESIICSPNCDDPNKIQVIPSPLVYSCGVTQMWGKEYTSHFRFLPCETVTRVKTINLKIDITMKADGVQPLPSELCAEIKKKIEALMTTHEVCPNNNCFSCSEKSANSARKKRAVSNTALQVNLQSVNTNSMNNTSTKDLLLTQIMEKNLLDLQSLNASVLPSSVAITLSCNSGQQLNGQTCVLIQAVPGTFLNTTTNKIEICPKGTYQPNSRQTSCIDCPPGKTTIDIISVSSDECKVICRPGSYFSLKTDSCIPCDIGFYQNKNGSFFCDGCIGGKVTLKQGSTYPDECVVRDKLFQSILNIHLMGDIELLNFFLFLFLSFFHYLFFTFLLFSSYFFLSFSYSILLFPIFFLAFFFFHFFFLFHPFSISLSFSSLSFTLLCIFFRFLAFSFSRVYSHLFRSFSCLCLFLFSTSFFFFPLYFYFLSFTFFFFSFFHLLCIFFRFLAFSFSRVYSHLFRSFSCLFHFFIFSTFFFSSFPFCTFFTFFSLFLSLSFFFSFFHLLCIFFFSFLAFSFSQVYSHLFRSFSCLCLFLFSTSFFFFPLYFYFLSFTFFFFSFFHLSLIFLIYLFSIFEIEILFFPFFFPISSLLFFSFFHFPFLLHLNFYIFLSLFTFIFSFFLIFLFLFRLYSFFSFFFSFFHFNFHFPFLLYLYPHKNSFLVLVTAPFSLYIGILHY